MSTRIQTASLLIVLAVTAAQAADTPPARVDAAAILAHTKELASDRYEGRAPGGTGEELTVAYLEQQFRAAGLKPGNPDGTFIQRVPLVGIAAAPDAHLTLRKGGAERRLKYHDEIVPWTRRVTERVALDTSDLVFVGYGVQAPEFAWDDFKGVDVKGKTLVVLINDPPVPDPANPGALDPRVFGGTAMTYYGRWTYKFDHAATLGAAGVIIVHETEPAAYPFSVVQGNVGEQFHLATPDKNMSRCALESWISREAAVELFKMAGLDYDAAKRSAASRDFRPVSLGVTASIAISNTLRTVQSRNVVAKLDGSDPALKNEYVVYTSHWDHLGIGEPVNGDTIYNGAIDNASGTASLVEIARAFAKVQPAPRRSVVFLAVTAEEQGLLGAEHYASQPLYPLEKTVANINMDGANMYGRTRDVTVIGLGASDLEDVLRDAAAARGRTITPDPEPEKGSYYRSDHFSFARKGVPALYIDDGVEFIGKPPGYAKQVRDRYRTTLYHRPDDEVEASWVPAGAAEDADLLLDVGLRVANQAKWPEWKPGNEFRAIREAQLGKR